MKNVLAFLRMLGTYRIPLLIVCAELLAAIWLLRGFVRLYMEKNGKFGLEKDKSWREFFLLQDAFLFPQARLVLKCGDLMPVFVSEQFETIFGVKKRELEADVECFLASFRGNEGKKLWERYRVWQGNTPFGREFQLKQSDAWYRLTVVRSRDEKMDCFQIEDITAEQKRTERLEAELAKAREASQSKTAFLSNMSHEIRTPMNGIIGMLTLADGQLSGHSARQYISKAQELSGYLLSVINDILDMSRIEAGKIELEEKPFRISAVAEKLRSMFQKNIEAKGVAFSVELQDFDVNMVVGDELRISQVLVNFLSNASKFTSKGEISLIFRQLMKSAGKVSFLVRVHDTGTGMDPAFVSRIFKPFEQENVGVTKKHGGSGLGMAITDQLVRLMGGEIVIDTMPGRGSDFTVYLSLPIAEIQENEQGQETEETYDDFTFAGCHILMAEDNAVNTEIVVSILELDGATVDVAENGRIAVEKFAAAGPGTYDFILMDIQMPVMDGRTAAMKIRQMEREDAKTIPIFALSADAFVEDRRLSAECGMNGHFAKPIDFEEVRKAIGKIRKEHDAV